MSDQRLSALIEVLEDSIGGSVTAADDFYECGGYSLLIIQIVRRLEQQFGMHLDVTAFGRDSRIGALAQRISVEQVEH